MAWTYIGYTRNTDTGSGTSLDGDTELNIQAGDLLVGICLCYKTTPFPTPTISDGGDNDFTFLPRVDINNSVHAWYGYILSAEASASATITYGLSVASTYRTFIVLQFRPENGAEITLESSDIDATGNDSYPTSDPFNTPAGDVLVVAGHGIYGGTSDESLSNPEIAGEAADGCPWTGDDWVHMWYSAFSDAQNSIEAEADLSGSVQWFACGALVFSQESAQAYSLECDNGSISLSGQAATLKAGRKVSAAHGSFSLFSQAAGLATGRKIAAAYGALSLAGQNVDLLRGYQLGAGHGSFTLAGQAATLTYSEGAAAYELVAETGFLSLAGQAASLLRGLRLPAAHGSLSFFGQAADLLRGYVLITSAGAFALSGQGVELLRGYLLEIEPGVFVLTGLPAALIYSGELQQREILTWAAESTKVLSFQEVSTKMVSERAHSTKVIEFDAE